MRCFSPSGIHEEGSSASYQQVTLDHRAAAGALDLDTLKLYLCERFTWSVCSQLINVMFSPNTVSKQKTQFI